MFITFEGLDFCGKSTQATEFITRLQHEMSVEVLPLREPGGTRIAERIRGILLDRNHLEMHPLAELLLFSASRSQLVHEIIRPALARGAVVVSDRFYDSTTAYQGYGRGLDLEAIRRINTVATGGLVPDLTFLVDIEVEEIERRKLAAGVPFDRMESSGKEFYQRVCDGYRALAAAEPRVVTIDGMGDIGSIARSVWKGYQAYQQKRSLT